MHNIWRPLVGLTATALILTGCSAGSPDNATISASDSMSVAVAFYPFEFIAERVGGTEVNVTNLTQPGAEAHDLELTAQQIAGLADAALLVYQAGFQPAIDDALQQVQPAALVNTADFVTFLTAEGETDTHDHSAETETDPSGDDPHTWLDPDNMIAIAEHVRDALSQARPAAASSFASNTKALIADLKSLDTEFKTGLANCAIDTFITSHAAFGYLAHRYNLTQVGIRGLEPDVEPSAARIAEVQQIAKEKKVTTIFFETLVSPVVSESLAGDLGLKTDVLDPLEGITSDSKGTDYLEVMRANLTALRSANQCS